MTLKIERFVVCSTGEEMEIPEPADSLEAAIKLRDEKQAGDEYDFTINPGSANPWTHAVDAGLHARSLERGRR